MKIITLSAAIYVVMLLGDVAAMPSSSFRQRNEL